MNKDDTHNKDDTNNALLKDVSTKKIAPIRQHNKNDTHKTLTTKMKPTRHYNKDDAHKRHLQHGRLNTMHNTNLIVTKYKHY